MWQELQPFLQIRQCVLDAISIDILAIPSFWENFLVQVLFLRSEHYSCPWDATYNNVRIEIKYAQASDRGDGYYVYFWRGLQGNGDAYSKDTVDYYILVGYDGRIELSEKSFILLGFRHDEILKRRYITKPADPAYRSKFDRYIKTLQDIKTEIQTYKNGWQEEVDE